MPSETKSSMSGQTIDGDGPPWTGGPPGEWTSEVNTPDTSEVLHIHTFGFVLSGAIDGSVTQIVLELDRRGQAQDSADDRPKNAQVVLYSDLHGNTTDKVADNLVWGDTQVEVTFVWNNVDDAPLPNPSAIRDNSFGLRLKVTNKGQSEGLVLAIVYNVTITVHWDVFGTGSNETPYGEEGDFTYLPFSALVRHFMGIDTAPTGPKHSQGDLFLAQFVLTGEYGFDLTIGAHQISAGLDPVFKENSSWKLVGKMSKLKMPLTGYTLGDIAWGSIGTVGSSSVLPEGAAITRRYIGFRIFNTRDTNGFLFPNCVIDEEENILCFTSLNPWDTRIYSKETLIGDIGGGNWRYPDNSMVAKVSSIWERFNTAVFLYCWGGLGPDGAPALTFATAKNDGPGTGTSEDWMSVAPGWTLYLKDANPSGCDILEDDAVLNSLRMTFPKTTSQGIAVLYQGIPIEGVGTFFDFADKPYANQTFKYRAEFRPLQLNPALHPS